MASPELSARLRFLNDSAHLLAATAPETSRVLMTSQLSLLHQNDIDLPEPQKRNACTACGTIMILGWAGTIRTVSRRTQQRKGERTATSKAPARAMVYECNACDMKTQQILPRPPQAIRHTAADSRSKNTPVQRKILEANTSTTSSKSRKRKKAKDSGLEALLAKKKVTEASGSGFDLMDFMKQV